MSVVRNLQRKISRFTGGLFATWMPDDRATIGDYGQLQSGRLNRHGNLENKGIPIETYEQKKKNGTFQYSEGVKFTPSGSAQVSGQGVGEAKLDLEFTTEGAFVYHSQGATYYKIDNRDDVFSALVEQVTTNQLFWDDTFVLVDEACHCDHSTILISEATSGAVSVSGKGNLTDGVNLANADGNLKFTVERGGFLNYAGETNSNPLYHAIRLKFPDPPGGGGGGPGLMQPIGDKVKHWLGVAFPKPGEIDVSPYSKDGEAYVVTLRETGATMMVTIESPDVEDLFSNDPTAFSEDDIKVETVEVDTSSRKRTANG